MQKRAVSKYKIGFFPGVWDLLHPGHVRALKYAKSKCETLWVGVNAKPTNKKPIMSAEERCEIVGSLACVDIVYLYDDEDELHRLDRSTLWDARFMGEDHKKVHHEILAKIVRVPRKHKYSTTSIKKRVYELCNSDR